MIAVVQRNAAVEQTNIAVARQLAAVSGGELPRNLDVALLLAARAYRTNPNPQTRAALVRAVTFSPHLVRYLPMGGRVAQLAGSGDGRTVLAGLADGRVLRWSLAEPTPSPVAVLPAAVSGIAVSRDGTVAVASGGSGAVLWRSGRPLVRIEVPSGQEADAVALSPSGRTAVVHATSPTFEGPRSIVIFDVSDERTRSIRDDSQHISAPLLVAASDDELLLLDGVGGWERRRLSDWSLVAGSGAMFSAQTYAVGTSSDGRFFTETNGHNPVRVWQANGPTDYDEPDFTVQAPIRFPTALALSPDGAKAAVADSGIIYVSPVVPEGAPHADPVQLVGNGNINPDGVRFFGDDSHLISASNDKITIWDLGQIDRLSHTTRIPLQASCNACAGPRVVVAPDGRRVAVVDGDGRSAVVQVFGGGRGPTHEVEGSDVDDRYGPPVWDGDSTHIVLPIAGGPGVPLPRGLPGVARVWPAGEGSELVEASGLAPDKHSVIVVDTLGRIFVRDIETGAVRATFPGPPDLPSVVPGVNELPWGGGGAAINSPAGLVAITGKSSVSIIDVRTGTVVGTVPGDDASSVAFSGRRLLVQRGSGSLEVWDERGSARQRTLSGDENYVWPPVADQQGSLVARRRSDGSVVLADLDTGSTLATFPSPTWPLAAKTGIAFSPAGTQLISVIESVDFSAEAKLVLRDLADENLVRTACLTAGRDLTPDEWLTFVGTDVPHDLSCR